MAYYRGFNEQYKKAMEKRKKKAKRYHYFRSKGRIVNFRKGYGNAYSVGARIKRKTGKPFKVVKTRAGTDRLLIKK